MKLNAHKNLIITTISALISLGIFLMIPVPLTLYSQPNDGLLKASDAITIKTPLQQCFENEYSNISGLDILLATYDRTNTNTNHVEIFTLKDNQKNIYHEQNFNSRILKDNDFYSISFPPILESGKICFLISSADATAENSITYWMNSQSQPVLKLKTTVPFYKAIDQLVILNPFHLPNWMVVALCFTYIFATVSVIFLVIHEKQQQS